MSPRATSTEEPDGGNLLVRIWRGAGTGNLPAYSTTAFPAGAPPAPIGIKLSIDSFRKGDGFVLLTQILSQDLRCCTSFSRCFGYETFGSGTDTCEKTTQGELGLKDGLHPACGKGLEMAHKFEETQLTLFLHPERSTYLWAECIIE